MKALGITHIGSEKTAEMEISELLGVKKTKTGESVAVFSTKDNKELAGLCYRSQSLSGVMLVLGNFELKGKEQKNRDKSDILKELTKAVKKTDFSGWLKNRTFRVNCQHLHDVGVSGQDIAEHAGGDIVALTKAKAKMEDPDIIILVYITEKICYIGIDFAGFDMSKRDYKIYAHSSSLNGSVAYGMLRAAGYKKGMTLLDPFCGSGIIPIEAALFSSGISPNFFRKDKFAFHRFMDIDLGKSDNVEKKNSDMRNVEKKYVDKKKADQKRAERSKQTIFCSDHLLSCIKAARNNAKIADVHKQIAVTKADIEWLDTRYDKCFFDIIATAPPVDSKMADKKQVERVYKEFLHQAEFVLKKNGRISVILPKTELLKKCVEGDENFRIADELSIYQGKQKMSVVVLKKD